MPPPPPPGHLCKDWAPSAFVVSFKLETEEALLVPKATAALRAYGVHAVVANELNSRAERVTVVSRLPGTDDITVQEVRKPGDGDIESTLIMEIVEQHRRHRTH